VQVGRYTQAGRLLCLYVCIHIHTYIRINDFCPYCMRVCVFARLFVFVFLYVQLYALVF
jgi:hypothetical protein